jgi:hypothetical protein
MYSGLPKAYAANTYWVNTQEDFENATANSYFQNVSGGGYRTTIPAPHAGLWEWKIERYTPATSFTRFDISNGQTVVNATVSFWYLDENVGNFSLCLSDGTIVNSTQTTGGVATWKQTSLFAAGPIRYFNSTYISGTYSSIWIDTVNIKLYVTGDTPPPNTDTLAAHMLNVYNSINWTTSSVQWKFIAYSLGQITLQQLSDWCSNLSTTGNYGDVLLAYTYGRIYGIENETTIKWALDNAIVMANGLPNDPSVTVQPYYFRVAKRYLLQGFYWAQKYNYDLVKWDVSKAYDSLLYAVQHATQWFDNHDGPIVPVKCVYEVDSASNSNASGIVGGPRYYDEAAETLDCFLVFYQLGITSALDEATVIWNWLQNFWTDSSRGLHYRYGFEYNSSGFPTYYGGWECEGGSFEEIILKYRYYVPDAGNISRLTTDQENRFLANRWGSPQWYYTIVMHYLKDGGDPAYAQASVEQKRVYNSVTAWTSIYGNYWNLTDAARANITDMIKGYDSNGPAWEILRDYTGLFNSTLQLYKGTSGDSNVTSDASIVALNLLKIYGIVPDSAILAIPLSEYVYEDESSAFDTELFGLNLTTRTLSLGIIGPGVVNFYYGSTLVPYTFTQNGVYSIQFASDWNSISSVNRTSLPTNRLYFSNFAPTSGSLSGPASANFGSEFVLSTVINDANGISDLKNCTLGINALTLGWNTSTAWKISDPNSYIELISGSAAPVNTTAYTVSWTIRIKDSYGPQWLSLNSTVYDVEGGSGSAAASNIAYIEVQRPGQTINPPITLPSINETVPGNQTSPEAVNLVPGARQGFALTYSEMILFGGGAVMIGLIIITEMSIKNRRAIVAGRKSWQRKRERVKKIRMNWRRKKNGELFD